MLRSKYLVLKFLFFCSLVLLLLKAFLNLITFDEAQTYLNYVYTNNLFNFGIANNHPFNTFLIYLFTKFKNTVFFIRLPNVIFGIVYIFISYKISKGHKSPVFSFLLLVFNIYLIDFFSLGRGYGISASLILFSFYMYFYTNFKTRLFFALFGLIISSYTIYYTSIILFSFCIIISYSYIKVKNIKSIFEILLSLLVAFPAVYLMNLVSNLDKNLITGDLWTNNDLLGFYGLANLINPTINYLGSIQIFLLFVFLDIKKIKDNFMINSIFFTSFLFFYFIPLIFNKQIPIGRIFVPFLPLLFLFFILNIKLNLFKGYLISLLIIFNFIINYEPQNSLEWDNSFVTKELFLEKNQDNCTYKYSIRYFEFIHTLPAEYYRIEDSKNFNEFCK